MTKEQYETGGRTSRYSNERNNRQTNRPGKSVSMSPPVTRRTSSIPGNGRRGYQSEGEDTRTRASTRDTLRRRSERSDPGLTHRDRPHGNENARGHQSNPRLSTVEGNRRSKSQPPPPLSSRKSQIRGDQLHKYNDGDGDSDGGYGSRDRRGSSREDARDGEKGKKKKKAKGKKSSRSKSPDGRGSSQKEKRRGWRKRGKSRQGSSKDRRKEPKKSYEEQEEEEVRRKIVNVTNWHRSSEKYLADIGEKSRGYTYMHQRSERWYRNWDTVMYVPIVLLMAVIGSALLGTGNQDCENSDGSSNSTSSGSGNSTQSTIVLVSGILNLSLAALGGLYSFLSYKERAGAHKQSASTFQRISQKIQTQLLMEREDRDSCKEFVDAVSEEYISAIKDAPSIPWHYLTQYERRARGRLTLPDVFFPSANYPPAGRDGMNDTNNSLRRRRTYGPQDTIGEFSFNERYDGGRGDLRDSMDASWDDGAYYSPRENEISFPGDISQSSSNSVPMTSMEESSVASENAGWNDDDNEDEDDDNDQNDDDYQNNHPPRSRMKRSGARPSKPAYYDFTSSSSPSPDPRSNRVPNLASPSATGLRNSRRQSRVDRYPEEYMNSRDDDRSGAMRGQYYSNRDDEDLYSHGEDPVRNEPRPYPNRYRQSARSRRNGSVDNEDPEFLPREDSFEYSYDHPGQRDYQDYDDDDNEIDDRYYDQRQRNWLQTTPERNSHNDESYDEDRNSPGVNRLRKSRRDQNTVRSDRLRPVDSANHRYQSESPRIDSRRKSDYYKQSPENEAPQSSNDNRKSKGIRPSASYRPSRQLNDRQQGPRRSQQRHSSPPVPSPISVPTPVSTESGKDGAIDSPQMNAGQTVGEQVRTGDAQLSHGNRVPERASTRSVYSASLSGSQSDETHQKTDMGAQSGSRSFSSN